MGLIDFFNRRNIDQYFTFARIEFEINFSDLTDVGVSLWQFNFQRQYDGTLATVKTEEMEGFKNDLHFWTFGSYMTVWFAIMAYMGWNEQEWRNELMHMLQNNMDVKTVAPKLNPGKLRNKPYVDFLTHKANKTQWVHMYHLPTLGSSLYMLYLYGIAYQYFALLYPKASKLMDHAMSRLVNKRDGLSSIREIEQGTQKAFIANDQIMLRLMEEQQRIGGNLP